MEQPSMTRGPLSDPALPALGEMLGPGATEMLDAAFAVAGERVEDARATQVSWRPGRSVEVCYDATVLSPSGSRHVSVVAAAGGTPPPGTTVVHCVDASMSGGGVAVWQMRDDPFLPGMRAALSPDAVRSLLAPLGVPAAAVHLRLRAYRPGRRAVIEVVTGSVRLFLKVIRPQHAAALQERHRVVAAHLPAPASHGWSSEHGILVLGAVAGQTLREALATDTALPPPSALAHLMHSIPAIGDGAIARSPIEMALAHAPLLQALVPDDEPLIGSLHRWLSAVDRAPPASWSPVHGDFHAAQVMVEDGVVSGVLDLDTAGLGDPVGDWATLIGHLHASCDAAPADRRPDMERYTAELLALARQEVDEAALAAHVAAVAFGLATGPFRVQLPDWFDQTRHRLRVAASWARQIGFPAAARFDEKKFTPLSRGIHPRASA